MKIYRLLLVWLFLASNTIAVEPMAVDSYVPHDGFVPNAETAIRVACAVWLPIYGVEQIEYEKPYNVVLNGEVWTVTGSLPKRSKGGVALVEISKRDGRVIRVSHGK